MSIKLDYKIKYELNMDTMTRHQAKKMLVKKGICKSHSEANELYAIYKNWYSSGGYVEVINKNNSIGKKQLRTKTKSDLFDAWIVKNAKNNKFNLTKMDILDIVLSHDKPRVIDVLMERYKTRGLKITRRDVVSIAAEAYSNGFMEE